MENSEWRIAEKRIMSFTMLPALGKFDLKTFYNFCEHAQLLCRWISCSRYFHLQTCNLPREITMS